MTHGKNKNIMYSNMEYNRYMTDDRNRKSGDPVSKKYSKFCNYDNCNKTAIYNYWGIKPKFCLDHKNEYMINIPKKTKAVSISLLIT